MERHYEAASSCRLVAPCITEQRIRRSAQDIAFRQSLTGNIHLH